MKTTRVHIESVNLADRVIKALRPAISDKIETEIEESLFSDGCDIKLTASNETLIRAEAFLMGYQAAMLEKNRE